MRVYLFALGQLEYDQPRDTYIMLGNLLGQKWRLWSA